MARIHPRPSSASTGRTEPLALKPADLSRLSESSIGGLADMLVVRIIFIAVCAAVAGYFHPFALSLRLAVLVGVLFALAVILFEIRLRRASLKRLLGAACGSILGIFGAYLMTLVLARTGMHEDSRDFLSIAILLVMTYVGLIIGANKGDMLNLQALGGLFGAERTGRRQMKVFDTSVIIDGRVADICEAHFLDGSLLIPQFVLRELQLVADSADALKRQRGRRGLEVLQRIQKMAHLQVEIAEDDFPNIPEVDMKLIELAKRYDAKIITNDFNLNKVATLQGIDVLNVNQLANALKPVVLPGEAMRVFILREGKEYNQGVAYLDDGTMVVVDGARRMINRNVDITVTSVHQTTAGKMIFGRFDERAEQHARQAAAPAGEARAAVESPSGGDRPARPSQPDPFRE
ncbi:MAG TPA: PIN domain-containing protein [Candidatus Acidoferrales bacterium]|nr:PIN domain-containing protein [Candidatus Acidoferrales bacterium]